MNSIKLNTKRITEQLISITLGAGITALLGYIGLKLAQRVGGFSYVGLTRDEIMTVYSRLDATYPIISRTTGGDANHSFTRGLYGSDYPLYYRLDEYADGTTTFELYPMVTELWGTYPDILGLSGKPVPLV